MRELMREPGRRRRFTSLGDNELVTLSLVQQQQGAQALTFSNSNPQHEETVALLDRSRSEGGLQELEEGESLYRGKDFKNKHHWTWVSMLACSSPAPNYWHVPERAKHCVFAIVGLILLLALALIAAAGLDALHQSSAKRGPPVPNKRYDGDPTVSESCSATNPRTYCGSIDISKADCESLSCCWAPAIGQHKDAPSCFHRNTEPHVGQYRLVGRTTTALGYLLQLELHNSTLPGLGHDMGRLQVQIEQQTRERLHIRIAPSDDVGVDGGRWEVPDSLIPRPPPPSHAPEQPLYKVHLPEVGQHFWLEVNRSTGAPYEDPYPVFSTKGWGLVFKDQYMQVTTSLDPNSTLLGLGETVLETGSRLPRNGKVITMWNADTAAAGPTEINLYGSHPFYMEMRTQQPLLYTNGSLAPGGNITDMPAASHGVFLLNSNGMDVELWSHHLTYRVIGGVLDFYIFMGPGPEQVAQQYHAVIGLPALPPLWSLGWHQCRWGYTDLGVLVDMVKQYKDNELPLDVVWSDIDYMSDYRIFTTDPDRYPASLMSAFILWLHQDGMHWVPILDPAVQYNPSWSVYTQGVEKGVFVRDATGLARHPYIGQVWAGPSAWPDFFNPVTISYWADNIAAFRSYAPADGLWLDMNEVSSFCSGQCHPPRNWLVWMWRKFTHCRTCCLCDCTTESATPKLDAPPYQINNLGHRAPLHTKTMPASARHHNMWPQYHTHNLYSLSEAQVTYRILVSQTQRRPFLLSRSTFPGLGRYAAHWTGDNAATWNDLRWSITGMLSSNLWGIPLVGADICGFMGNTYEELCARWIEAGAFYTFSRNHGDPSSPRHEAYVWPQTQLAAQTSLRLKYRLLPYLYTAFYVVSQKGGTVARPLAFEWPADAHALNATDSQWLLGSSVMIAPILEEGASSRHVYFPGGELGSGMLWYRLPPGDTGSIKKLKRQQEEEEEDMETDVAAHIQPPREVHPGGSTGVVAAPIGSPSVWQRAGSILATLAAPDANTVKEAWRQPLQLWVGLPASSVCTPVAPETVISGVGGGHGSGSNNTTTAAGSGTPAQGKPHVAAEGQVYMDDGVSLLDTDAAFAAGHRNGSVPSPTHVSYLHMRMTAGCTAVQAKPGTYRATGYIAFNLLGHQSGADAASSRHGQQRGLGSTGSRAGGAGGPFGDLASNSRIESEAPWMAEQVQVVELQVWGVSACVLPPACKPDVPSAPSPSPSPSKGADRGQEQDHQSLPPQPAPLLTPLELQSGSMVLVPDSQRVSAQSVYLNDQVCSTEVRVGWEAAGLLLQLQRPVPLLCLSRVVWDAEFSLPVGPSPSPSPAAHQASPKSGL